MTCACGTISPTNHARWCPEFTAQAVKGAGSASEQPPRTVTTTAQAVNPAPNHIDVSAAPVPTTPRVVTPEATAPLRPADASGEFSAPRLLSEVEKLRSLRTLSDAYDQLGVIVRGAQALRQAIADRMWEHSMTERRLAEPKRQVRPNQYGGNLLDEF